MARVDFFVEKKGGKIFPERSEYIPDSFDQHVSKMWKRGIPFRQLIDKLIDFALEQHAEKARTKYSD